MFWLPSSHSYTCALYSNIPVSIALKTFFYRFFLLLFFCCFPCILLYRFTIWISLPFVLLYTWILKHGVFFISSSSFVIQMLVECTIIMFRLFCVSAFRFQYTIVTHILHECCFYILFHSHFSHMKYQAFHRLLSSFLHFIVVVVSFACCAAFDWAQLFFCWPLFIHDPFIIVLSYSCHNIEFDF